MNQLTESLWGDEGFSAIAVQQPFLDTLGVVMRDTAPPLFYIVGWTWGRLFGFSEVSLRSLSLLLMTGAAVFAGMIVWRLSKDKVASVMTFLLASLAPFLVPYAFEWRMYALLNFMVMGSIYFFVIRSWWGYVIFSLGALYTHHFGLFTIAGQGIWFLVSDFEWNKPKKYLRQLWPFLVIGAGYVPWLYPMYLQVTRVQGAGFWLNVPTSREVGLLLLKFLIGGLEKKWWIIGGFLAGIMLVMKAWPKVWKKWLELLVIVLSPVGLSYLVSYLVTPVFYDRYLLSVVVGMMVLLVLGTKKKPLLVGWLLVLIFGLQSWQQFSHPSKRPFREMAAYVKQELRDDDYLLNYNGGAHHIWESKYYGIPAPIYTPNGPLPLYVGTAQMKEDDTVDSIPEFAGRLGVIASEPVESMMLPGFSLIEYKEFGSLRFSWWSRTNNK